MWKRIKKAWDFISHSDTAKSLWDQRSAIWGAAVTFFTTLWAIVKDMPGPAIFAVGLAVFTCAYVITFLSRQPKKNKEEYLSGDIDSKIFHLNRVPLLDFLKLAEERGWRLLDKDSLEILDIDDGFVQAAVEGLITIYGRYKQEVDSLTAAKPLLPIPAEFWAKGGRVDMTSTYWIKGADGEAKSEWKENSMKITADNAGRKSIYADIHLKEQDVEVFLEYLKRKFMGNRQRIADNR